jgi:hypothetical protein
VPRAEVDRVWDWKYLEGAAFGAAVTAVVLGQTTTVVDD